MRTVNLLPRDESRRKSARLSRQTQLLVTAPVIALVALGAGWYVTKTQLHDRQATLQTLQAQLARLPAARKQAAPGDPTLKAEHDARVAAVADALSQRVAWDRILRQI